MDSVPARPGQSIVTRFGPVDDYWIDAAGHVAGDIHCLHCAYNLKTLPVDGRCPECGEPVADSEPLYHRPLAWLRKLRWGAALLLLTVVARVCGGAAVMSVSGQWPRVVGETWAPDLWFYAAVWLGQTVPGLVWFVGVLLLTSHTNIERLPFRRPLRLLLLFCAPLFIVSTTAEASYPPVFLTIGRTLGLAAHILLAVLTCLLLLCAAQLMRRVPRRWLARSAHLLLWLAIPAFATGTFFAALSMLQTIYIAQPDPPYAYEAPPVDANGQPLLTTLSTTMHYMVVDEHGAMTRTTTVPASLLLPPGRPWPKWLDDMTELASFLHNVVFSPALIYACEFLMFVFFGLIWRELHRAVRRRAALERA